MSKTRHPSRPRSASKHEAEVLAGYRQARKGYVVLKTDKDRLTLGRRRDPYRVAHRMAEKGLLLPVGQGRYVIAPEGVTQVTDAAPFELALHAHLVRLGNGQYFISYLSGLIEHRLTDLDSDVVYVASRTRSQRLGVEGREVVLTEVSSDRKWFGAEAVRVDRLGQYMRATIERTLLDTLDRPRFCGAPEVWVRGWERAIREDRVDLVSLVADAPRLGKSVARRAAFWMDRLGVDGAGDQLLGQAGARRAPVLLDPSRSFGDGDWPVDWHYGLRLNLPESSIRGWLSYGK
jgi:predicted transcriptional regulator of viral defense system